MRDGHNYSSYGGYIGRVVLLVAGLLVLGFLIWLVIQIADDDNNELADGQPRGTNSSQTIDEDSNSGNNNNSGDNDDLFVNGSNATEREARNDQSANAQTNGNSSNTGSAVEADQGQSATIARTGGELPDTGAESVILAALSLGAMAFAFQRYMLSKD